MSSSKQRSKKGKKNDQQQAQLQKMPSPCSTKEEEPIPPQLTLPPPLTPPVSQLTLRPVCVASGDAIFITVEHNGGK